MTKIRLAYVQEFIDRHGIVRRYFRKAGCKRVLLPGSPDFNAVYESALASLPKPTMTETQGSIAALVVAYYKSDAFTKALAPETQRMRRNILDRLREQHGDKRVRTLERRHIVMMLEKKAPYAQKNWLKTLRGLMLFAVKENYRADDPTAGVNAARPVIKSHGHMTWGEEQIAVYRERHPIGTMARLAIELVLNIAARRGDAHQLGAQHIKRGRIEWRPSKTIRRTGKQLQIPILPELQTALDAMPTKDTSLAFLLNEYGRPFASAATFGQKFAHWCKQAGLEPVLCPDGKVRAYRIHGLRKAACVALAHAQCTGPQIMAISGHSSLAQVQVYIEEAERGRMADAAIEKLRART
ncbi:MAG: tyrosine-type recombinase/integrase [Pseudolabrys sp.]